MWDTRHRQGKPLYRTCSHGLFATALGVMSLPSVALHDNHVQYMPTASAADHGVAKPASRALLHHPGPGCTHVHPTVILLVSLTITVRAVH